MMMIENICALPNELVMGVSALIGALAYAGYSIYCKKKENPTFKVEPARIIDTAWQSIATGVAAGLALGCGIPGIVMAMLSGIGMDKVTNKLKIKETDILNITKLVSKMVSKK